MSNRYLLEPLKPATRKDIVVMYELLEIALRDVALGEIPVPKREELVGLMNEGYKDVNKLNR